MMLSNPLYTLVQVGEVWSIYYRDRLLWTGTEPDEGMSAVASNDYAMEQQS
jgi:hypothetical protein